MCGDKIGGGKHLARLPWWCVAWGGDAAALTPTGPVTQDGPLAHTRTHFHINEPKSLCLRQLM